MVGANVGPGANSGSLGIMIVGNYNSKNRNDDTSKAEASPPEGGAIRQLFKLVGSLKKECPSLSELLTHQTTRQRANGCLDMKKNYFPPGKPSEDRCQELAGLVEMVKGQPPPKPKVGCTTSCPGAGCMHLPTSISEKVF